MAAAGQMLHGNISLAVTMGGGVSDREYWRELSCLAPDGTATLPLHSARPGDLDSVLASLDIGHSAFLRASGFTAAAGQLRLLPGPDGLAGAVLGLGNDRSPFAHGALSGSLPPGTSWHLVPGDFDLHDATLGFCLGAYRFDDLKTTPPESRARLAVATGQGHASGDRALLTARATWMVRDLVNMPANLLGPAELADATLSIAARFGAVPSRVEGDALLREYPTVAAVGAGSDRPPVVAGFTWSGRGAGPDAPLLSLCGKGVCFDSGGYDLKPSSGMLRMKKDMGGAALLLGLAALVMASDLPLRLQVRIGCVENMVSGRAFRPLDVLHTRRGLTVEVGNTDAEGRLVLCDLLAEASDAAPALLIDAATLTGAARVALGPDLPALFCPKDSLANRILEAAAAAHDPLWRLPLWDGYDPWLASGVADLGNVSSKPMAGAITAALFLRRFVAENTPWVHLDTYAWNDQTRPGRPEGGEALGLRALFSAAQTLQDIH